MESGDKEVIDTGTKEVIDFIADRLSLSAVVFCYDGLIKKSIQKSLCIAKEIEDEKD